MTSTKPLLFLLAAILLVSLIFIIQADGGIEPTLRRFNLMWLVD